MEEIDGGFLRIFFCLFVLFIYLHFEGSSGGVQVAVWCEIWVILLKNERRFHFRLTDTIGRLIRWHRSVHRKCRQRAFETPGPGERLWDGRSWRYVCERPVILGTSDGDPPEAFDCVPHWTRWHQLGGPVIKRGFFIDWAEMMEIQVAVSGGINGQRLPVDRQVNRSVHALFPVRTRMLIAAGHMLARCVSWWTDVTNRSFAARCGPFNRDLGSGCF